MSLVHIKGPAGSGKMTFILREAAKACAEGKKVLFVDYNAAYVPEYAESLGVPTQDPSRFVALAPFHLENSIRVLGALGQFRMSEDAFDRVIFYGLGIAEKNLYIAKLDPFAETRIWERLAAPMKRSKASYWRVEPTRRDAQFSLSEAVYAFSDLALSARDGKMTVVKSALDGFQKGDVLTELAPSPRSSLSAALVAGALQGVVDSLGGNAALSVAVGGLLGVGNEVVHQQVGSLVEKKL